MLSATDSQIRRQSVPGATIIAAAFTGRRPGVSTGARPSFAPMNGSPCRSPTIWPRSSSGGANRSSPKSTTASCIRWSRWSRIPVELHSPGELRLASSPAPLSARPSFPRRPGSLLKQPADVRGAQREVQHQEFVVGERVLVWGKQGEVEAAGVTFLNRVF